MFQRFEACFASRFSIWFLFEMFQKGEARKASRFPILITSCERFQRFFSFCLSHWNFLPCKALAGLCDMVSYPNARWSSVLRDWEVEARCFKIERLKLGASRLRGWSSVLRDWTQRWGRSFATGLRQRVINPSLEAAEDARSDHPCQREPICLAFRVCQAVLALSLQWGDCNEICRSPSCFGFLSLQWGDCIEILGRQAVLALSLQWGYCIEICRLLLVWLNEGYFSVIIGSVILLGLLEFLLL